MDPCGEPSWKPYKDEKCFKLLTTEFVTRDQAENLCANERTENDENRMSYLPSLAEIHSAEEQEAIQKYIHNNFNVFDNIWLEARRGSDTKFYWNNKTEMKYTNWEDGTPSVNTKLACVAMLPHLRKGIDRRKHFEKGEAIRNRDVNKMQEILDKVEDEFIGM
jgi:hypothetical protein